jgi:3-dehydroquinate dehydratase-1
MTDAGSGGGRTGARVGMIRPMLEVRGVRLGGGTLAVIVPLTGADAAALVAQAAEVRAAAPDLVEWRVDLVDLVGTSAPGAPDLAALVSTGRRVVDELAGLPLLVTIRTAAEGGRASAEPEAYLATLAALVGAGVADLVDVEVMLGAQTVRRAVRIAHDAGVPVVASNHDIRATPARAELMGRLRRMVELGADVLKIAVTPLDAGDVLELLAATWAATRTLDRPVIAISMGDLGVVTRLAGGVFGSAATFATVGPASAPGQRDIAQVRAALALLGPVPGGSGAVAPAPDGDRS